LGDHQFVGETAGDDEDQAGDQGFNIPESAMLKEQHDDDVGRRDNRTHYDRNAEQQVQRDGRADHFGQVGRGDGDLAQHPQEECHRAGVMVAAA
jgi:hypothetical protein